MISILTPSFGYGRFIADAIESVRLQGHESEHIICDGMSTDGTAQVASSHAYRGLKFVAQPDTGQSDALNKAFAISTGTWICWLNADEFYLPGVFDLFERASQENPAADIFFGDVIFVDENGLLMRLLTEHAMSEFVLRYFGCFVPTCSVFIRRSILGSEPWDAGIERVMDWELFLRLSQAGARFHYLRQPVAAFRLHDAQITALPASCHRESIDAVARRYALRGGGRSRALSTTARTMHVLLKLVNGGWLRESAFRKRRGVNLRWFEDAEAGVGDARDMRRSSP